MARHAILTGAVLVIVTGYALYLVSALWYFARFLRMPDKAGILMVTLLTLAGLWAAMALWR